MNSPRWMKIVLWILGAMGLINGIAMFFAPATWFFKMVPGVPETGPFNAHLVADSGTFFIAVGVGLVIAGFDPRRHVAAVIVAAIANLFHSILHLYSHEAGLLSLEHLGTEVVGIYIPTLVLIAMAILLTRNSPRTDAVTTVRAA
ncbi:MAG TPA: hypothetical protein VMT64_10095 [Candidatus Binataceae bacterium]|nr:hypothetical protein [Candidatus Binataceae bacterium]